MQYKNTIISIQIQRPLYGASLAMLLIIDGFWILVATVWKNRFGLSGTVYWTCWNPNTNQQKTHVVKLLIIYQSCEMYYMHNMAKNIWTPHSYVLFKHPIINITLFAIIRKIRCSIKKKIIIIKVFSVQGWGQGSVQATWGPALRLWQTLFLSLWSSLCAQLHYYFKTDLGVSFPVKVLSHTKTFKTIVFFKLSGNSLNMPIYGCDNQLFTNLWSYSVHSMHTFFGNSMYVYW